MITVTNNNDAGAGSFRQAVLDAGVGEEIQFGVVVGTIALTTGDIQITQDVVITGPGSSVLTVSSAGARVFHVLSGTDQITGLTIGPGAEAGADGGGIWNETTLTLNDIIVDGCTAVNGGGIANNSTITMTDVSVQNCEATADGGGIYNVNTIYSFNLNVTDCEAAGIGGGIYNNATFEHSGGRLSDNVSPTEGGGMFNEGTYPLTEVTVSGNSAPTNGDGIFNSFGTVTAVRCTFSENIFTGIYNYFGTATVQNSTLSNNGDTAIVNAQGNMLVKWCTITGQQYALVNEPGSVFHGFNTIFCGNGVVDIDSQTSDFISDGCNIIGTSTNAITPATGDLIGVLIGAVQLGPLQNNGGTTFTHALLATSIAIDAGNNAGAPLTDQRLSPRIVNSTIDIGAYEAQETDCTVFTGTLPAWLTLVGDCFTVVSGSFRAPTKDAANTAAATALNDFIVASLESGDLNCDCVPPEFPCPPLATFSQTEEDGELTEETPDAPHRAGSHGIVIPFVGQAGWTINIYMQSDDFDTYLILVDPDGNVVEEQAGTADNSGANTALTYELLQTGTYTIEATTDAPGATGEFTVIISPGSSVALDGTTYFYDTGAYAPTSGYLFIISGTISNGVVAVVDTCTNQQIEVLDFTPEDSFSVIYGSFDERIYVTVPGIGVKVINPITLAIDANIPSPSIGSHYLKGIAFDSNANQLFTSGNPAFFVQKKISVIDLTAQVETDVIDFNGVDSTDEVEFMAYCPTNNQVYVCRNKAGNVPASVYLVDATTKAINPTSIPINAVDVVYEPNTDRIFLATTTQVIVLNPSDNSTVATIGLSGYGFRGIIYNPAIDALCMTVSINVEDYGGMIVLDKNTYAVLNYIQVGSAINPMYSAKSGMVYVVDRVTNILYAFPLTP